MIGTLRRTNPATNLPYPQFVTGDAINLSGLFKWRGETIDPIKDAKTGPGYFSAKCGFTGQLLLMGGNCQAQFGWYNVTDPTSKTPPAANRDLSLHEGKAERSADVHQRRRDATHDQDRTAFARSLGTIAIPTISRSSVGKS